MAGQERSQTLDSLDQLIHNIPVAILTTCRSDGTCTAASAFSRGHREPRCERGLAQTWKRTFAEAGIVYAVHEFGGECSLTEIERIKQAARNHNSKAIVGAGGGKVLDAARAAAMDLNLPVVNCPTAAFSDAP